MTSVLDSLRTYNLRARMVWKFTISFFMFWRAITIGDAQSAFQQAPVELSVHVAETKTTDFAVANLTKLLFQQGINVHSSAGTLMETRFELLDLSANLLNSLHSSDRSSFGAILHVDPAYGIIRFLIPLDRERLCPESQGNNRICALNLLLVAYLPDSEVDQTTTKNILHIPQESRMIYIDFNVFVDDINDNIPYFPKLGAMDSGTGIITVQEECPIGTLVSLPRAIDIDSPAHGVRYYDFHPSTTRKDVRAHFEILTFRDMGLQCENIKLDSTRPVNNLLAGGVDEVATVIPCLHVIQRIDRESVKEFGFRLVAVDSEDQQGEISIHVIVKDINDHTPEWANTMNYFGTDGRIHSVTASRKYEPRNLQHNANLSRMTYEIQLPECSKQKKLIQLKANDADDVDTPNGQVSYRLGGKTVELEKTRRLFISNDHVYLTGPGLRGLSQTNFSISVVASDGAGLMSEALIVLRVQDCNNHRPVILMRGDELNVPENLLDSVHLVSLITVRDLDLVASANSEFHCALNDTTYLELHEVVKGPGAAENTTHFGPPTMMTINDSLRFQNPSRQGRWSIFRLETRSDMPFDREQFSSYTVTLVCVDNGSPALSSYRLITVNVVDENDNAPVFYERPSKQSYASGRMWQSSPEVAERPAEKTTFEFHVAEGTERGSLVGHVRAFDLDWGENARIIFELLTQNATQFVHAGQAGLSDMFTVSISGEIHLIGKLDRELEAQYVLLIVATDFGKPRRLSSTATVFITIDDVNDCHPEFNGEYIFEVVESYGSSTIHQILGRLNATDKDSGRNGTVSFRIANSQDYKREKITVGHLDKSAYDLERPGSNLVQVTHDGQVTIYGVVDRERTPVILFDVIAEDNGKPSRLSSMTTVTIHVLDLNDNKPRFIDPKAFVETAHLNSQGGNTQSSNVVVPLLDPAHMLNISLDTDVGTLLTKFETVDPDDGPNGTVTFELVNGGVTSRHPRPTSSHLDEADDDNEPTATFMLHEDGRLVLSRQLDFEEVASPVQGVTARYRRPDRLLIRASDNGPAPEHTLIGLHITYYDPLPLTKGKELVSFTFFHSSPLNPTDPNGISSRSAGFPEHQQNSADIYVTGTSARSRSRKVTGSGVNGVPIVYLLALAVCFALILVITSLVYLYVKMKKPAQSDRTPKVYGAPVSKETNVVKMVNRYENALEDFQHEYSTGARSASDGSEHGNMGKGIKSGTIMISDANGSRTLSPHYLLVDRYNLIDEDSESNTNMMHRWTSVPADYTELLRPGGSPLLAATPMERIPTSHGVGCHRHRTQSHVNGDTSLSRLGTKSSSVVPRVGELLDSEQNLSSVESHLMEQPDEKQFMPQLNSRQGDELKPAVERHSADDDKFLKPTYNLGHNGNTILMNTAKLERLQQHSPEQNRLTASFV